MGVVLVHGDGNKVRIPGRSWETHAQQPASPVGEGL